MNKDYQLIAREILSKGNNVIFTGAGISTESGIPDYRSKGGIWDKFRPVYFDEFMSSHSARIEYWRRKAELYDDLVKAEPNNAHIAIAELYEMGLIKAVITQNIDGLHQKAGVPDDKVIELHGNTLRIRCMSCNAISSIHDTKKRIDEGDLAPECSCGGYLKPDTISFGQTLRHDVLNRAKTLASTCNFFLVIGSTLLVYPAAGLPEEALHNDAFLAIVNLSETPYDDKCDVLIRGKAGEVLPKIVDTVIQNREK